MNLKVVGHTDLGGTHQYGAAAAVGSTLIVATNPLSPGAGAPGCESSTVEIVSVDKPASPRVVDAIQRAQAAFDPLPFDTDAARAYGRVFSAVMATGRTARGARAVDLLIAATAVAAGLPLYTRNGEVVL